MNTTPTSHEITSEVIQVALKNPNGWVYKIEGNYGAEDNVPPDAIVGAWKVNADGILTGEFLSNPNYVAKKKT